MAKKKKGGGGGTGMPAGFPEVVAGTNQWNDQFHGWADDSIAWGQDNPYSQSAQQWQASMLQGDMSTNPFMSRIYNQTSNLDMNEGLDYLRGFLGQSSGGGVNNTPWDPYAGTTSSRQRSAGTAGTRSSGGTRGPGPQRVYESSEQSQARKMNGGRAVDPGTGGTGPKSKYGPFNTPDSTAGVGWFEEHVADLYDPARLDPANDPTMQPMIDAIQRESEESYWRSITDLTNQMEGAGRYGTGTYQAMRGQAGEEYNEALQATMAQQYQAARNQAIANQMQAMGYVNQRDMNEAQVAAQLEAARMQADASSSASNSANQAAREIAEQQMRLQGIGMMMEAGQFGMGLGGNMAELLQNGQLGAGQLGLGFGELGMSGYDRAANFGQLGLGAMGQLGNIYGSAAQNRLAQQAQQESSRRYNQEAPMRDFRSLVDIMSGLNDMAGYGDSPAYVPGSAGPEPGGFDWADFLGSAGAGYGAYANFGQ